MCLEVRSLMSKLFGSIPADRELAAGCVVGAVMLGSSRPTLLDEQSARQAYTLTVLSFWTSENSRGVIDSGTRTSYLKCSATPRRCSAGCCMAANTSLTLAPPTGRRQEHTESEKGRRA